MQKEKDSFLAGIKSGTKSYNLFEKLEKKKGYRQQRVAKKKKTSRKGASPYNKFVAKQSPIIRAANPGKAQPEIMKLIAKAWADEKKK